MPLDLPDYSKLNEMYTGPLAARMAQDNYDQKGRLAQLLLQQQQQSNQDEAALAPIKRQIEQGRVYEQQAQLPGIMADSGKRVLGFDQAQRTHEDHIADVLKGYQNKISDEDAARINKAADVYGQVGNYLKTVPGPAQGAAAKQFLGSFWRPEFEQVPPGQLAEVLSNAGQWMGAAKTQYAQAREKQDKDIAAKLEAERIKTQKAKDLAVFKASVIKKTDPIVKSDKPNDWQKTSSALLMQAAQEPDEDKRAVLVAQAQVFINLIMQKERQKAAATSETKPDVNKLGMDTNAPVPLPTVSMPGPGASSPKPTAKLDPLGIR
jgi:Sec-independent protein translocase protein TatA